MNEMYNMGIVTHYYSVIGVLLVIFLNFIALIRAKNIKKYQIQMYLYTPVGSMAIAAVIFTGIVMMAAKHLDFTLENIVMILFSILVILLEVKRVKTLKYLESDLDAYKMYATKLLFIEVVLVLSVSAWMLR